MTPADRWAAVLAIRGVSPTQKLVLLALAHRADATTLEAWPSVQRMADETSTSRMTVIRALAELANAGLITVVSRSPGRHPNRYRVNLPQPSQSATVQPSQSDTVSESDRITVSTQPSHSDTSNRLTVIPEQVREQVREQVEGSTARAERSPAPATAARGTRLADDWRLPDDWLRWALDQRPEWTPEVVREVAAVFADYWRSMPGKDGRRLNWSSVWKNWIRRERRPRGNGGRWPPPDQPVRYAEAEH